MIPGLHVFKFIWIHFWVGIATIVVFFPIVISSLLSRTGNPAFLLSKGWSWVMLQVTGIRPKIRGREKIKEGQPYIIIANHQSHFDAPAIIWTLGIQFRWVVKKELFYIPLFGYALYAARNIFVDRSDRDKAVQSIRAGIRRLPPGVSVLFFAEGTRSPDGQIQKFKKGGFVTAIENQFPVLPVTVNGSRSLLPKGSFLFKSGTIEVVVGDPIETRNFTLEQVETLLQKTRDIVIANFNPNYPDSNYAAN